MSCDARSVRKNSGTSTTTSTRPNIAQAALREHKRGIGKKDDYGHADAVRTCWPTALDPGRRRLAAASRPRRFALIVIDYRECGNRVIHFTFEPAHCSRANASRGWETAVLDAPPERWRGPSGALQDRRLAENPVGHDPRAHTGRSRGYSGALPVLFFIERMGAWAHPAFRFRRWARHQERLLPASRTLSRTLIFRAPVVAADNTAWAPLHSAVCA